MSEITPPLFEGKYVILRHLSPADAPLYYGWLQNPAFMAYKPYLNRLCPTPQKLFVHLALQAQTKPRSEIEVLVIAKQQKIPLGLIGLASIDRFNQKAEFLAGFSHGYGTPAIWESIHAGITLGFARFKLHKLICYITPNNYKALKIMQRYGFSSEGYFQEELLVDNQQRVDLQRFALMRRAWQDHPLQQRLQRLVPVHL